MALIKFAPELLPFTANTISLPVDVRTVAAALQTAFNTYPQLYIYFFDTARNLGGTVDRYVIIYNDEELLEQTDLSQLVLSESDTLELVEVTPAGHDAGSIGAAFINALFGAGTVTSSSLSAVILGSVLIAGAMIALNMIMGALMGDVEMPDIHSGSLDNSATYTFTGIKNTTAAGTPVQIVYGSHRTGGQVLALFTSSDSSITNGSASDTYLYYQLGLSEGEIAGISDVEVNKLPYTFYQAVFTAPDTNYIRLGASSQLPMYEFNQIANTTTISRKVLYGGAQQATTIFSDYTPAYGYVTPAWGTIGKLTMGLYTPVISWQPDPE